MPICLGVKTDGMPCNRNVPDNATRCAIHMRTAESRGPHAIRLLELEYIHTRLNNIEYRRYMAELNELHHQHPVVEPIQQDELNARMHELSNAYRHRRTDMKREQDAAILLLTESFQTAAEAENRQRQNQIDEQNLAIRRERNRLRHEARQLAFENRLNNVQAQVQVILPIVQNRLNQFANDAQNVHTTEAVDMTTNTIKHVLNITRPANYMLDYPTKDIFAEIVVTCPFTTNALIQFTHKYWERETIHGFPRGIYNQVADAVWYYIKTSPHKTDLCAIFANELRDSVGMCAQGNLTRLCNVLSGYLDGIGDMRSKVEILGDAFISISKLPSLEERIQAGVNLLSKENIPQDDWREWLDPLAHDGEDDSLDAWLIANAD
jgi:hypothetical protein